VLRGTLLEKESLVGALGLLSVGLLLVVYVLWASAPEANLRASGSRGDPNHPNLNIKDKNAEQFNAVALDIIETLDCHKLLKSSSSSSNNSKSKDADKDKDDESEDTAVSRRRLNDEGEEDLPGPPGGNGDVDGDEDLENDLDKNEDVEEEEEKDKDDEDEDNESDEGDSSLGGGSPDDDYTGNYDNSDWKSPTAKHLFCLAAFASNDQKETGEWKDSIKCDATHSAQKSILELWSMARVELDQKLLLKVLDMSVETQRTVVKKDLNLWAPRDDTGLEYMVSHVNEESKTVDQGGLYGLEKNLGAGHTFVDVGSCLGTTSMAISLLYPGTRVVSIEAASPNWMLQELNFRCNAEAFPVATRPTIMLAGVGPVDSANTFARYTWKPDHVTTARSWTPQSEIKPKDEELAVKLRPWHSILAEAEITHDSKTNQAHIDVLNVDCGACEYNLIPSMTQVEFDSIHTVMGGLHWGYIPKQKLPSSKRAKETHERLCKHENFAAMAKECCEFPDLEVVSSYPGQVLVQDHPDVRTGIAQSGTVKDVAGELCTDYDTWATEKHVHDIVSDWGWFQLTPSAKDD